MSKQCEICNKKPQSGNSVSHSHRKVRRKFYPNLQTKKIEGKKITICTSCIKNLSVT